MAKEKIKVSIIIPSWNTKKLLRQCLKSLNSKPEIIVVDNGSTDGSPEMVKKEFPGVILVKNKKNLGYGKANNQGMKQAKGEYFLLLNSDTKVKDKAPLKMAKFMDDHPQAGALGCKLLNVDGTPQPSAGPFPNLWISAIRLFFEHWSGNLVVKTFDKDKEVDWVMGAALMVRPAAIKKAGFMDENIFMYMDEVEFCYRIKKAGFQVMFSPGAEIVHLLRASSKTGRKDPIINIYRGLVYFYQKHYSPFQLFWLRLMLKLKAYLSLLLGLITNNNYLKETYGQALRII